MSFSGGTFSINSTGQPVVAGTSISASVFNSLTSDLATGLSTCMLKDGTQTITQNIPMAGFKFTGLGAGSANGDSLRYEQLIGLYQLLSTYTTAGDIVQATGSGATARLGIGTAYQRLATNSGATAAEWVSDTQNTVVTTAGDIMQATANRTIARLGIGTAGQFLKVNSGATAAEWAGMSPITNSLSGDVACNNTSNYFTGPTIAQGTAGTWFASGSVTLIDTAGAADFNVKLWDGTTVIASGRGVVDAANTEIVVHLSGYLAAPAGNIRISVNDATSTSGAILFNGSGNSKDSTLSAIRIA